MRIVNPNNRVFILNYPSEAMGQLFSFDCNYQSVTTNIYPWSVSVNGVTSFSDILFQLVNDYLTTQNLVLDECSTNSLISQWFVQISVNDVVKVNNSFFNGTTMSQVPNDNQWRNALVIGLNQFLNDGFFYFFVGNQVTIYNLKCENNLSTQKLDINVGINFTIQCN